MTESLPGNWRSRSSGETCGSESLAAGPNRRGRGGQSRVGHRPGRARRQTWLAQRFVAHERGGQQFTGQRRQVVRGPLPPWAGTRPGPS